MDATIEQQLSPLDAMQDDRNQGSELAKWLALELAQAKAAGIFHNAGELGEAAGVSRQTISRILNKRTRSNEATITKLAAALDVPCPHRHQVRLHGDLEEVWSELAPHLGALPPYAVAAAVEIYQRAKSTGLQDQSTEE